MSSLNNLSVSVFKLVVSTSDICSLPLFLIYIQLAYPLFLTRPRGHTMEADGLVLKFTTGNDFPDTGL